MVLENLLSLRFNDVSRSRRTVYHDAELTVADAIALLPGQGTGFSTVYKFSIAWVRATLAALAVAVDDKNDHGECKAALSTYYINLNAAKSEVKDVGDYNPI